MLDPGDSIKRIDDLLRHFEDLNQAHEAVLRAKRQTDLLTPLVERCDRHGDDETLRCKLAATRDGLDTVFAAIACELIDQRRRPARHRTGPASSPKGRTPPQVTGLTDRARDLAQAIDDNGGNRLTQIDGGTGRLGQDSRPTQECRRRVRRAVRCRRPATGCRCRRVRQQPRCAGDARRTNSPSSRPPSRTT